MYMYHCKMHGDRDTRAGGTVHSAGRARRAWPSKVYVISIRAKKRAWRIRLRHPGC